MDFFYVVFFGEKEECVRGQQLCERRTNYYV